MVQSHHHAGRRSQDIKNNAHGFAQVALRQPGKLGGSEDDFKLA
jgi:hypothetical protein